MSQNYKEAYIKGQNYFENKDFINARYWFEISYQSMEFREKSLEKLIYLDLKEGNFAKARKMLKENIDCDSTQVIYRYGLLEAIENNFETSKKYYRACMADSEMQCKSLMSIANLYIQTGDNDIARKILESLQFDNYFKIHATIKLVCLNILEHHYKEAEGILKSLDQNSLPLRFFNYYRVLDIYIKKLLNKLNQFNCSYDPVRDYLIYRMFDNSDQSLLNHISKHVSQNDKETNGYFFKGLDLSKLLINVKEQIVKMNANHSEFSDMYRFRLNSAIGFGGQNVTRDLCVATIIGTKKIITMYPILLSDDYDKEGYSTSNIKKNGWGKK